MISNIGIMINISLEKSLLQPMAILFCSLAFNDAMGAIVPYLSVTTSYVVMT